MFRAPREVIGNETPPKLGKIFKYFIHPNLRESVDLYWQAKVLISAQLILQLVCLGLVIFSEVNGIPGYSGLWILLAANPILLFVFKRYGNLVLSGNLAVAALAIFTVPMPMYTGGIYSDDMIWLMLVPVMAFTLTNFSSGLIWTILLLVSHGTYYYFEITAPISFLEQTAHWTPEFYYTSITLFFFSALMLIGAAKVGTMGIINEQHKNQNELSAKTKKLEELTNELKQVERILRNSNKELEQFAYVVSHDLKQPLRSINSFSTLLEKHVTKRYDLDDTTKEYLDFIKTGTVNMNQLIEDIITYSRAGSRSELEDSTVKMQDIKMLIEHNLRQQIEETGTSLIWQNLPEQVDFSKVQMVQLLQNLISNAMKYRREDVDNMVIVSVKDELTYWEFSIQDNGRGISEADIKRVFGLFIKLQGTKQEGSGIGLATCKKIVENAGGKISLQSQLNSGSTFTFTVIKRRFQKPDQSDPNYTDRVLSPTPLN